MVIQTFIANMPKAELHVHIEGTLEPELAFRLAERNGIQLPYASVEALRASYNFYDLPSFLAIYYRGMSVLLTEQDFYDLTYAYLQKAHSQQVLYAEIFFDPQAHTLRGVSFETVIQGIHRAQEDAWATMEIQSQLIMCFLRDLSPEFAMETLLESLSYKDWIVGVGLDSNEKDNPPIKFKEVFARARQEGYCLTLHCDVDQENSTQHIWQGVNEIEVDRIDHGVNALEDQALCHEIKRRNLALTFCPISNQYGTGSLKAMEFKQLLNLGIRVTVNSDDPAYFQGYINENFLKLQAEVALSKIQLLQLVRNAFECAWLAPDSKQMILTKLDSYASKR